MIRAAIITVSDSAVAGTREDRSGPALVHWASAKGWQVERADLVPDDAEKISALLVEIEQSKMIDVAITTGGTGVSRRDVTPDATRRIADREIPGFGELMRSEGLKKTAMAPLSRGGAFTRGEMLVVNLPGSPKGAVESVEAVAGLIPHVVDLLQGRTEHDSKPQVSKPAH
jgi:molybdopterin adenylyltransferase